MIFCSLRVQEVKTLEQRLMFLNSKLQVRLKTSVIVLMQILLGLRARLFCPLLGWCLFYFVHEICGLPACEVLCNGRILLRFRFAVLIENCVFSRAFRDLLK